MKKLILIKIGGSSITNIKKERVARLNVIRRLANEIKRGSSTTMMIVGHGSGSFAHNVAKKYRVTEGMVNAQSLKGVV
jgi:isopentenyl phosphate kinase